MAGEITVNDLVLPVYGSVYSEEVSNPEVEFPGSGLDLEGMVGDDIEIGVFFDYMSISGFTFSAFVVLTPPPLKTQRAITVVVTDAAVGLISVKLSNTDTKAIGPVADKPWFLTWNDGAGNIRTVLMGKLVLNRPYYA